MSSTSTNKQPLLVDRPLHDFAILGSTPCLSDPNDFSSLLGGGCALLVDCSGNDGAVVDSLSVIATQASTTGVYALFFLSTATTVLGISNTNTALVASALVGSVSVGERTNVALPPLTIPVPSLGGQTSPTEFTKKNTGVYVPAGLLLYTGINTAILAPTPATKINVFAQGGFF